jgi:serine/threonine-protein kinase/endoribonuclease IRE1
MAPFFFLSAIALILGLFATAISKTITLTPPVSNEVKLLVNVPTSQYRSYIPNDGAAAADSNGDIKLLDVVLLASVDGKLHALNRTSGRILWSMSSTTSPSAVPSMLGPLIRTDHVESDPDITDDDNVSQELYIIEPQSGDIYVLSSSSPSSPLNRLSLSMSQLVDLSPFSFAGDEDKRMFVGKKETSLLLIDLETGKVKATLNSECPWDPFEDLHESVNGSDLDELDELHGTTPRVKTSKPMEVFIGRTGS